MKREFLTGLGLEKEVIDKIMDENGNDIQAVRKELDETKAENDTLKTQQATMQTQLDEANNTITAANAEIESYKGMDIDGVKAAAADWQTKYEALQEESKTKLAEVEQQHAYDNAVRDFMSKHTFTSAAAKRGFEADLRAKGLTLDNGKLLGADDYAKEYKESDPDTFKVEGAPPPPVVTAEIKSPQTPDKGPKNLYEALQQKFTK